MNIYALPEVKQYLNNLITILYEKGYFSYEESAKKYVDDLFDDITNNLSSKLCKPAPKHFERYGKNMEYATFKKSKHTTWYVFFDIYKYNDEVIYLVRHIENNHTAAQYLI